MSDIFRIDFYAKDWLLDTQKMSLEERGVFIQIVAAIYHHGGPIDNDPRWLANLCNCSVRKIKTIVDSLLSSGDISLIDDKITQRRAEIELTEARKRRENATKNARKLHENEPKTPRKVDEKDPVFNENNDIGSASHQSSVISQYTTDSSAREKSDHVRVGEQISKITGWDQNPSWFGDYSRIEQWLANGWDAEMDIYPTVKRLMAKKTGPPPTTLKYFEQAIADAYAYRNSPIPKGKADGKQHTDNQLEGFGRAAAKHAAMRSGGAVQAGGFASDYGGTETISICRDDPDGGPPDALG